MARYVLVRRRDGPPVTLRLPAWWKRAALERERARRWPSCSDATGVIKGGIGTSALDLGDGLIVGAIVAVNAVGGVVDPETSEIVAGPLDDDGISMLDSMKIITSPGFGETAPRAGQNTTIGVVATNATLTKSQANKLADVSHDGLAMAVRPAHLMSDGDTMFALATGGHEAEANMNRLCAAAALCTSRAIVRAARKATGLGGVKAVSELQC